MGNLCIRLQPPTPNPDQSLTNPNNTEAVKHKQLGKKLSFDAGSMVRVKKCHISEEYTLISPAIGNGSYGDVYKAIQKATGLIRAAKCLLKNLPLVSDRKGSPSNRAGLAQAKQKQALHDRSRQYEILRKLVKKQLKCQYNLMRPQLLVFNLFQDHPNIIRIYEIYETATQVFIVTQLCSGGELFEKIIEEKRLTESIAAKYMSQIFGAVAYLHSNNVIHRDLKPENILFSKRNQYNSPLKIIDFGTSIEFRPGSNETISQRVGTTYYIAPEVLKKAYDQKCDVWSCGVIMYIMLSGQAPFQGRNEKETIFKILSQELQIDGKVWKRASNEAKDLLKKLLEKDPSKRITAANALKHPWIAQNQRNTKAQQIELVESVSNMQSFQKMNRFQEGIVTFISNYLTSVQERNDLIRYFKSFDHDNNGTISKSEMLKAYKQIYSGSIEQMNERKLQQLFDNIDVNRSGQIDYAEFVSATMKKNQILTQKNLQDTFAIIDADKSGKLSPQQIASFLGGNMEEELINSIIKECDQNRDGEISKEEFLVMMQKIAKS